jgi:threonine dehydratase
MSHCKIVPEGAAAAPIAVLLQEKVKLPRGTKVVCVVSGGNLDLDQLKGLAWN